MNGSVKEYYLLAFEEKEKYKTVYNELLGFTNPSYKINDEEPADPTWEPIEPIVATELNATVSFVMSTLLSRGGKFATLSVDEMLMGEGSGYEKNTEVNRLNNFYSKLTDSAFKYLNSSNYFTEISKAMWEAIVIGTGCYYVDETNNKQKPFTFRHIPMDNFFYWADAFGNPNHTFKKYYRMTLPRITTLWGDIDGGIQNTELFEDDFFEMTLIESVIPVYNELTGETTYTRYITDDKFEIVFAEDEKTYNPYIVFRWSQLANQVMGTGLAMDALKAFKDLKASKEARDKQVERINHPTLRAMGDKELIQKISFGKDKIIYGGSGAVDNVTGIQSMFDLAPVVASPTLVPIEQDIQRAEAEIREVFMTNPLGQMGQQGVVSASEVNARMTIFRNRFAGPFEILQSELLEPTLLVPIRILIEKELITLEKGDELDTLMFNYENEMARQVKMESTQKLIQAIQTVAEVTQFSERALIDPSRLAEKILDNYGVDEELKMTEAEQAEALERKRAQMQEAEAVAMQQ